MNPKRLEEMTYNELLDQIANYESQKARLSNLIYTTQKELQKRRAHVQQKLFRPEATESNEQPSDSGSRPSKSSTGLMLKEEDVYGNDCPSGNCEV